MQSQGKAPPQIEHYIIERVYVIQNNITNTQVVIKIINKKMIKNSKMEAKIRSQIRLLRQFNHPNVIKLYEVFDTPDDNFQQWNMHKRGELFDLIAQKGKLSEAEALELNIATIILLFIEILNLKYIDKSQLRRENS
ncbi:unnamed protein product (macronuclear) [Paramecium tetraurelia]|uniref:Protein kinase domain-containing protein n=1 Tax=Paramecium tetraurelia TaxID=5888 RepID=A0CGK0_PARTE|nr:uncharacterized protein GSPATT00007357001 [Paramecium tetraurelia]CAK69917.1 unnamed protein product [Paramecium tetraurelia]|eukprot:XP_001437314.1 hypothetical protein (macronuclear) [Paramecium tetraurelia strain d4-2]